MTPSRAPASPGDIPPSPWLGRLEAAIERVPLWQSPEDVHTLRVSASRLRVWLRLGGRRMLRDDLGRLRDAAGAVRDLDVMLASDLAPEARRALEERLAPARAALVAQLASVRTSALLRALRLLPPAPRAPAQRRAARWLTRTLKEGARLDWGAGCEEDLHGFRRRVRRARDAFDWLDLPRPDLKDASLELGLLNDLFVLRRQTSRGDSGGGDAPSASDLEDRVRARRAALAQSWPKRSRRLHRSLRELEKDTQR